MFFRTDYLMQRAANLKYAFPSLDIFHMDIIDACTRAAVDNHTALALCCDCKKQDKAEVIHWLRHYSEIYPSAVIAPTARNISSYNEAMEALLLGYRGLWLDPELSADPAEVKAVLKIAGAADASVMITVTADTEIEELMAYKAVTGISAAALLFPESIDDAKLSDYEKKVLALHSTGLLIAGAGFSMEQTALLKLMYNAGISMVDIHEYAEANARCQKIEEFSSNVHSPLLFLNLVRNMAASAADSIRRASVALYSNRREF